jgi:Rrf2 family protein
MRAIMADMLLSQTAEYALRAMATLAGAEGPLRAGEIAQASGIPVHYVSKVLRRMVEAGLLSARKGHGGGFRLARPASSIRFREVIAAADGGVSTGRCAFGWGTCDANAPCPLHPTFSRLEASFTEWAGRTSLAQAVAREPAPSRRARGAKRRS